MRREMITPALREALTKQGEALLRAAGAQLRVMVLALNRAVGKGLPWAHSQDTWNGWGWRSASPRQSPPEQVAQECVHSGVLDLAIEGDSGPVLGSYSRALSL